MSQNQWYQDGLRFECTQCGNCCGGHPGYVWVNEPERRSIADHLGLSLDDFTDRYTDRVGTRYTIKERGKRENYDCVFLKTQDGKRVCGIYTVRPTQCRTWPFWTENLKSEKSWNKAGSLCPGINQGRQYEFVHIEVQRLQKFR